MDGSLYALDIATGKLLWKHQTDTTPLSVYAFD
jgi:outer membrane protein assembly factor BamB